MMSSSVSRAMSSASASSSGDEVSRGADGKPLRAHPRKQAGHHGERLAIGAAHDRDGSRQSARRLRQNLQRQIEVRVNLAAEPFRKLQRHAVDHRRQLHVEPLLRAVVDAAAAGQRAAVDGTGERR